MLWILFRQLLETFGQLLKAFGQLFNHPASGHSDYVNEKISFIVNREDPILHYHLNTFEICNLNVST